MNRGRRGPGRLPRRVFGRLAWPVRRLLDPRFADVNRRVEFTQHAALTEVERTRDLVTTETRHIVWAESQDLERRLATLVDMYATTNRETLAFVGTQLRDLADRQAELYDDVVMRRVDEAVARGLEVVDAPLARLLNHADSHIGFAAEAGLWFNPPTSLEYVAGAARLNSVNERLVEVPYAWRALGAVSPPARIVDIGSSESTFALSLASLGYSVFALDPRRYPLEHPNLEPVQARLEDWSPEEPVDAVLLISTLEHVGLGFYGETPEPPGADRRALERIGGWLRPGAIVVLTVPFAEPGEVTDKERRYDDAMLDELLAGWEVEDRRVVRQVDDVTWSPDASRTDGQAVALIVARPGAAS